MGSCMVRAHAVELLPTCRAGPSYSASLLPGDAARAPPGPATATGDALLGTGSPAPSSQNAALPLRRQPDSGSVRTCEEEVPCDGRMVLIRPLLHIVWRVCDCTNAKPFGK